jgi:transposase
MARRKFDHAFKLSAVQLVRQSGYSPTQAAHSLGVSTSHVNGWLKQLGDLPEARPVGDGAVAAELRRLREENAKLKIERDILKKAATFFAKEQP